MTSAPFAGLDVDDTNGFGPETVTLPVHIFSQIMWQADPTIAAASTLQILLIAVLLAVVQRIFRLRVTV